MCLLERELRFRGVAYRCDQQARALTRACQAFSNRELETAEQRFGFRFDFPEKRVSTGETEFSRTTHLSVGQV